MKNEIVRMLSGIKSNQSIALKHEKNRAKLSDTITQEYEEFLAEYNGGCGFIGDNLYVQFWSLEEIQELNEAYAVNEFIPGIVIIGSDGADTAYGISENGNYIEVPFIGMDPKTVKTVATSFEGFLRYLESI